MHATGWSSHHTPIRAHHLGDCDGDRDEPIRDEPREPPHRLPSPSSAKYSRPFRGAATAAIDHHLHNHPPPHRVDATAQTEALPQLPSLAELGFGSGGWFGSFGGDASAGDHRGVPPAGEAAGSGSSPETLRKLERLIEAQRAQLVSKGLISDDRGRRTGQGQGQGQGHGHGHGQGHGHGHQSPSPRVGRRSPGSNQPRSRRNNSLGGDGDLVFFESPMPNPERRGGNPSPVARPRGPVPRKTRTGNPGTRSSTKVSPEKNEPPGGSGGSGGQGSGLNPDLAALFSPSSEPVGTTASRDISQAMFTKRSASPMANRTLHFASLAPRVTGQTSTPGVAKPRPRPLVHAPAVARHLGVLEDDSALASPESGFSSDGSSGFDLGRSGLDSGPTNWVGVVRSGGGGTSLGIEPRLRVGSETGRGAFRVVGSFTPAPSSAFVAVEKGWADGRRGSASDVEAAKERVGWGDGPSGERGGTRGSSVLTQSLRKDAFE